MAQFASDPCQPSPSAACIGIAQTDSLTYHGNWTHIAKSPSSVAFMQSSPGPNSPSTATLKFTGASITVFGAVQSTGGGSNVTLQVDAAPPPPAIRNARNVPPRLAQLGAPGGLGAHTLVVTNHNATLQLVAFQVGNGTVPGSGGNSSSSLSTGAIAGISVGAVAGVAALAALLWWWTRRRRRRHAKPRALELDLNEGLGDSGSPVQTRERALAESRALIISQFDASSERGAPTHPERGGTGCEKGGAGRNAIARIHEGAAAGKGAVEGRRTVSDRRQTGTVGASGDEAGRRDGEAAASEGGWTEGQGGVHVERDGGVSLARAGGVEGGDEETNITLPPPYSTISGS
ncbi:uncharacterized protein BXZ73DRAFT_77037 [Epithele typhae]|uniref:uncharacterized protein n=1 Tax=Epithele typhae TaxID=378194 RepID=UPI002008E5E6|nr:uncharacterized protein BXZ73DRAFT_77037 [Epithele typhae]KAH9934566.1 hypothetical protein BXZ73DRAFT_77037 [Epithele typhae]